MSKSYRDRRARELRHHHKVCTRVTRVAQYGWIDTWCECRAWYDYRLYHWPVPSWWNRDIRIHDRATARNDMQRLKIYRDAEGWQCDGEVRERIGNLYYW